MWAEKVYTFDNWEDTAPWLLPYPTTEAAEVVNLFVKAKILIWNNQEISQNCKTCSKVKPHRKNENIALTFNQILINTFYW